MAQEQLDTDARWKRIEELFFAAADLPEEEREAFLELATDGDAELREEALSLLAMEARSRVDTSTVDIAGLVEGAAASLFVETDQVGARFGAYRIEREIGRGGMGSVYLASRADQEFSKQVAIKLIRRDIDKDAVLRRFLQERQVLAGLDHPGIARLLDGGTSADGRPWFALEYVEGQPIQRYCASNSLGVAERCELFRKVCEPVSYAHRNLVIHSDLKPANILVTPDGAPKLLDFGIARLLSKSTSAAEGEGDRIRALTPAYASPEQINGQPVSTASDVYSLGCILRELLTAATETDLDHIVAKATRTDPAERYKSVDELSEDVRRYLADLPVLARGNSFRYRAGKALRRHRVGFAAAAVCILLLVGGVASVLWEARQTRIQRQRAEQRLGQLVELANRTLLEVHGSIERLPGGTEARRRIIRSTLDYLDKLNTETGYDTRVLTALAAAYIRLASIEGNPLQPNLGDLGGAEQSYRKGARILAGLVSADPGNKGLLLESSEASLGLGRVLDATGRSPEALAEYRRGIETTTRILRDDPKNTEAIKRSSDLHLLLDAALLLIDGEKTRKDILEQIEINSRLVAEDPKDGDFLLDLAQNYSQLGVIAGREGHTAEGLQWHRKSVGFRERAFALHPNDTEAQRELMMAYGHIGDMLGSPFLLSMGDSRGASEYFRKAVNMAQAMVSADPSDRQARIDFGIALMRLGVVMDAPSEAAESLATLNRSVAILEPLLSAGTKNFNYLRQEAILFEYKARREGAFGRNDAALESYRRSLAICESLAPIRPEDAALVRQETIDEAEIAVLLAASGDREGALTQARKALADAGNPASGSPWTNRALPARASDRMGRVYDNLAHARGASGPQRIADLREAATWYRRALEQWKKSGLDTVGYFPAEVRDTREKLARCEREVKSRS